MSTATMVIKDPELFHLIPADFKVKIIEGGINTVNQMAFLARRYAQENIRTSFITRNTFTTRSVQVTQMPKVKYVSLSAIQSTVGITDKAGYMARQESGGEHLPRAGGTLAIPTDRARGGSKRNLVQGQFKLTRLRARKVRGKSRAGSGTHKSRAVARAAVAFRENKLVQYGGNLHFVGRFSTGNGRVTFRLRQVYGFNKRSTTTKARPWMRPAYERSARDGERIYISQMKKLGL